MIDERLSSSVLRKTISEPQTRGLNPQPSEGRWEALTIELPRLRWGAKQQVRHMCDLSGSHFKPWKAMLLMKFIFWKCACRTCTLAHHLNLCSSMVRASHRSSESCRFDPRLSLRNRFFLRIELDKPSSAIQ